MVFPRFGQIEEIFLEATIANHGKDVATPTQLGQARLL
jgi:hypothetical protein